MAYIVAEISANHQGSIEQAKELITTAHECGADAVKIQTYTPDSITIQCDNPHFTIQDPLSPWYGRNLYNLYKEGQTPMEWHPELFNHAKEIGITLFSSPFSKKDVDALEQLDCPFYKVASFEANDPDFIKYVASTGKPIIISTGQIHDNGIERALKAAQQSPEITLLHCVSKYPPDFSDMHLKGIERLKRLFGISIGLSDHSRGFEMAIAATALGATMIEKHLTLDANSLDGEFSINPLGFRAMVELCKNVGLAMKDTGPFIKKDTSLARSLFVVDDIKEGELFTESNVRSIRPGMGLPPHLLPQIIGLRATQNIDRGTPLKTEFIGSYFHLIQ